MWHPSLADWLATCFSQVWTWHRRSLTRRSLAQLDGAALIDIGRTEAERRRECAKWFWQGRPAIHGDLERRVRARTAVGFRAQAL